MVGLVSLVSWPRTLWTALLHHDSQSHHPPQSPSLHPFHQSHPPYVVSHPLGFPYKSPAAGYPHPSFFYCTRRLQRR